MFKRGVCLLLAVIFSSSLLFFAGCDKEDSRRDAVDIKVEYYDNGVIGGLLSVDYCLKEVGQKTVKFNCYPKALSKDAKISPLEEVENMGDFKIISVMNGKNSLEWNYGGEYENVLEVSLDNASIADGRLNIAVKFVCVMPRCNERMGITENSVNLGNWFLMPAPYVDGRFIECAYGKIGDPFVSDCMDFNVQITLPSKYVVAAPAFASSCDVSGERTSYSYALKNARDFALCFSSNFNVLEEKWGNKSVNYYYYDDNEAENSLNLAIKALDYFSKTFGEYPYEVFTVCQTDFREGGMEYPALVYLSDDLKGEDYNYALVHEIAHQWWYGVVGNDQTREAFLDEGLAEFSTLLFFDENKEYGIDGEEYFKIAKNQVDACEEVLLKNQKERLKLVRPLSDFNSDYEYAVTAYAKGLLTFSAMDEFLGEKKFLSALKSYFKENAYQIADTEDLKKTFKNCEKIIDYFVYGG